MKNKLLFGLSAFLVLGLGYSLDLVGRDNAPIPNSRDTKCIADENAVIDLRKKQTEVSDLKQKLDLKQKELESREIALNEEIKKLEDLRKEILAMETVANEKQEERVAKLVEAFEKMSPKSAAAILTNVTDDMAVMALSRLSTEKIAKVMGAMDTKRSSNLTELLAMRKGLARTPAEK